MGARGKKRRRKDGSIASGRLVQAQLMPDHVIEPVPAAALSEAMQDYLASEFMSDDELEDTDGVGILDAIADRYDVDADSLAMRADRLAMFLRRRGDIERASDSKSISIEPALFEHAASVPIKFHEDLA